MKKCVLVITRNGEGGVWRFDSLRAVRLSPLVQTYDVVADDAESLLLSYGRSGCESLGRRAPTGYDGDRTRRRLAAWSAEGGAPRDEVLLAASDLWSQLTREAETPPSDAETLLAEIVADREAMENLSVRVSAERPREAYEEENEVTDRAPRIRDTDVIHMGKDKEGKKYGKDHNPTRPGSAVHDRFAKYRDGMTVAQAKDAGLTPGDIKYHADESRAYITLKPDPKAEAAEDAKKKAA